MATALLGPKSIQKCDEAPQVVQLDIHDRLRRAMCENARDRLIFDRRRSRRIAYPYPIHLTPLEEDGLTLERKTIVVVGKHLSECGLDFYHDHPLAQRRMIVSLPQGDGHWLGLLVNLTWCHFSRHGWYENGGRFLEMTQSPLEQTG